MSSEFQTAFPAHRFSIAPMLDWTDRHCRYFLRQLSRHTLLYTEMVTTGAIIHGKGDYLAYSEEGIRLRCNWVAAIRLRWRSARSWLKNAAMTRLTSTSVARPTVCKTVCSARV